ncbi:MAG: hypothetical protein QW727_01865 [Candidatus Pacearchaeota archaeon]
MSEKDKVKEQKVKWKGIFDFKEIYQFMYRRLNEEGYSVEEQKYQEEVKGDEKDIEITWVATKNISDYFKNEIKLSFRILGLKKIEAEKNGKRIKTNEGGFEVKITGSLVKDYENRWENNPTMKFLRGVYDKYIVEGTINRYKRNIVNDIDDLTENTKAFLTIEGKK